MPSTKAPTSQAHAVNVMLNSFFGCKLNGNATKNATKNATVCTLEVLVRTKLNFEYV